MKSKTREKCNNDFEVDPLRFSLHSLTAQYILTTKTAWSFMVWMLTMERGRQLQKSKSIHPFHDEHLAQYIANRIGIKTKTAQKKINKAVDDEYLFIDLEDRIKPIGRNKLFRKAAIYFFNQDNELIHTQNHVPLNMRVESHEQFTGKIDTFISPESIGETTAKLMRVVLMSGSHKHNVINKNKNLTNTSRSKVQRSSSQDSLTIVETGVKVDIRQMFVGINPSLSQSDVINIVVEEIQGSEVDGNGRGKKVRAVNTEFQSKVLVMQGPNVYKDKGIFDRIIPAMANVRSLRELDRGFPSNTMTRGSRGQYTGKLRTLRADYKDPLSAGRSLPPNYQKAMFEFLDKFMQSSGDSVLARLGARSWKSPYGLQTSLWTSTRRNPGRGVRPKSNMTNGLGLGLVSDLH